MNDIGATGSRRAWALLALAACFFVQTAFVYFDVPGNRHGQVLSGPARLGLALWREHNCQACHQIHGFGGFLGPDLTNLTSRRPLEDWTPILTEGRKQMPAFHFDDGERASLVAFLEEIDATGRAIPRFTRLRDDVDLESLIHDSLTEAAAPGGRGRPGALVPQDVLRGEETARRNGCLRCHRPFATGLQGAPDPTLVLAHASDEAAADVIRQGRGSMPEYSFLTEQQIMDILACWRWMAANRSRLGRHAAVRENGDSFNWGSVPWFEF